jgi:hypothetical protein
MGALLIDLCNWDHSNRSVQKKWARAFCSVPELEIEPGLEIEEEEIC